MIKNYRLIATSTRGINSTILVRCSRLVSFFPIILLAVSVVQAFQQPPRTMKRPRHSPLAFDTATFATSTLVEPPSSWSPQGRRKRYASRETRDTTPRYHRSTIPRKELQHRSPRVISNSRQLTVLKSSTPKYDSHLEWKKLIPSKINDDELMRMEMLYYNITEGDNDFPKFHMLKVNSTFDGPIVRPDDHWYGKVIRSYANSDTKQVGALLAEQVAKRYEKHWGVPPTPHIQSALMDAWLSAGNITRAYQLLTTMEQTFASTQNPEDAPTTTIYKQFLRSLSKTNHISTNDCAVTILTKMRKAFFSGSNPHCQPDGSVYDAVMQCLVRGKMGIGTLGTLKTLYYLRKMDYQKSVGDLKGFSATTLQLFFAASQCQSTLHAYNMAKELMLDLQAEYKKTQDEDFLPVQKHYDILFDLCLECGKEDTDRLLDEVKNLVEDMKEHSITPNMKSLQHGKI